MPSWFSPHDTGSRRTPAVRASVSGNGVTQGSVTVTDVGMFPRMSRGRRSGSRIKRRPVSEEERTRAVEEYRESVGRLQQSAFRNLRTSIANVPIFFAVLSTMMILTGQVTPATLVPMALSIVGGALGVSTYAVRTQPLARYLLIAAVVLGAIGLVGTFVATRAAS